MKYLIMVYPYTKDGMVAVSPYNPDYIPTISGVFMFVLEANSEDEARAIGQKNWQDYEKESLELGEKHREESYRLNRKFKVLGYHQ
jgi:hypothetical protein